MSDEPVPGDGPFVLKIFGAPYGEGGESLGAASDADEAMSRAANHMQPGQHVRVYDAYGEEVNRIYPT